MSGWPSLLRVLWVGILQPLRSYRRLLRGVYASPAILWRQAPYPNVKRLHACCPAWRTYDMTDYLKLTEVTCSADSLACAHDRNADFPPVPIVVAKCAQIVRESNQALAIPTKAIAVPQIASRFLGTVHIMVPTCVDRGVNLAMIIVPAEGKGAYHLADPSLRKSHPEIQTNAAGTLLLRRREFLVPLLLTISKGASKPLRTSTLPTKSNYIFLPSAV